MKYQLLEHISLTEVDDEVVLLDLDTGAYFGLNHVGAKLLSVLHSDGTVSNAIEQISERYKIDIQQVERDINELIEQLLEQNLICTRDSGQ